MVAEATPPLMITAGLLLVSVRENCSSKSSTVASSTTNKETQSLVSFGDENCSLTVPVVWRSVSPWEKGLLIKLINK